MKTLNTLREVFFSSLPLAIIIIICVAAQPFESLGDYIKVIVGYACVVVGQSLFLVGLDDSILPAGKLAGNSLIKINSAIVIVLFGFIFGLLATVAEPALSVLAHQTEPITETINAQIFIWALSAGTGVFVGLALFRALKNIPIKKMLAIIYILVFVAVIFVPSEYVALAFDGSGSTTGDISVPFILSLGIGIMSVMSKRKTNDDIFGIIGIASVGSILALFVYGIINNVIYGGAIPAAVVYDPGTVESVRDILAADFKDVLFAVIPILLAFIPMQLFMIKLPGKKAFKMLLGVIPVCVGLFIFYRVSTMGSPSPASI